MEDDQLRNWYLPKFQRAGRKLRRKLTRQELDGVAGLMHGSNLLAEFARCRMWKLQVYVLFSLGAHFVPLSSWRSPKVCLL